MITLSQKRLALPYRDCAGIALFNRAGQVFVGRRKKNGDFAGPSEVAAPWQMPQGGIDKGEEPYPAALRELREETGVTSVRLLAEAPDWIYYDLPDDVLGIVLKGKYRGQRQKWFALLLEGPETEIDVLNPGDGSVEAEFDTWRWEDLTALPDLIVPFKRDAYAEVVRAFATVPADLAAGRFG